MKKIFSVLGASALCLAISASAGAKLATVAVNADETSHIVTETTSVSGLTPLAWYQFEDSENLGKDTMGNFDLKMKVSGSGVYAQKDKSEGDKYVELRRKEYAADYNYDVEASNESGVLFYAPFVKSGSEASLDMSDLITDSFTLSITFRSPAITEDWGSHYMFSTGRYLDAPSMVLWRNGVRVQTGSKLGIFGEAAEQTAIDNDDTNVWVKPADASKDTWYTVTMVGDADNDVIKLYLDGVLVETREVDGEVVFSNQGRMGLGNDYVFALGGQTAGTGGNACHADVDISDCKVFNYALSDANVSALNAGTDTAYADTYIDEVPELDVSGIDFQLTDVNTMDDVIAKLPTSISTTLSDGTKSKASVSWIKGSGKCIGVVQSAIANTKGYSYEYEVEYVVKFNYKSDHVVISDIKVGSQTMEPDEVILVDGSKTLSLSFKLEPKDGCSIEGVWYDDTNEFIEELWATDDEGYMYLRIKEGAEILIVTTGSSGSETPGDSTTSDSTSDSTTSETPSTPSSGDSTNNSSTTSTTSGGCGSVVFGALAPVMAIAVVAVVCKKERK